MPARYEIEPTQYVIRVYSDDATDYVASATLRVYGDRAWMSQISSPKLYGPLFADLNAIMDKLGIVTVEGYMSDAHARATRMAARGHAQFEITHRGTCAGRQMPWVIIRRLP